MRVVVVGGGPGGFSAAIVANKVGAEVILIERTNALGGFGLVAGVAKRGAASYVVAEEKALGGADLNDIFLSIAVHKDIVMPEGEHVSTYNITKLDSRMQKALKEAGVQVLFRKSVVGTETSGGRIRLVTLEDGTNIDADAFVDATGATEGPKACNKLGQGCVGCVYRCPVFGSPGGIVDMRVNTVSRLNAYGNPGVTGTSMLIPIASLAPEVKKEVCDKGYAMIPVPPNVTIDNDRMKKAGTPEILRRGIHSQSIILLDVGGFVKVTGLGSPMWATSLRSFPGLEDSFITQPDAGAIGHLVTCTTIALHDNYLKADGFDNLFCAGRKSGPTCLLSAIITGDLAGYNAVRCGLDHNYLELPKTLMTGAFISLVGHKIRSKEGLRRGYSVKDPETLKELNIYRENEDEILKEVEYAGLREIYRTKLC